MERMKALALLATVGPMDGSEETAAKSDDLAAFDLLMRQHERLVLVTALRLLGRLEDAQDASQEVFLRLYRNLNKVRASGNLAGWLYRVTVNVCHDAGRKRRVSGPVEDAGAGSQKGRPEEQCATGGAAHSEAIPPEIRRPGPCGQPARCV
jgi:RNA polymerase sigma-70 factor (ECF subfamily)